MKSRSPMVSRFTSFFLASLKRRVITFPAGLTHRTGAFLGHVHAFILPIGMRYSGVWFSGSPIADDIP